MKSFKNSFFLAIIAIVITFSTESCAHQRYAQKPMPPRPPRVSVSIGGGYYGGGTSYGANRVITPYYNGYANNHQCYHRHW